MKNTVIAVTLVRSNASDKFLMICSDSPEEKDYWYFPHGFVRPGDNLHDAAVKSVLKQTEIRCRVEKELYSFTDANGAEWHYLAAGQIYGRACPSPPTIKEVKWCTPAEIASLLDADLPDAVRQWLNS